MSDSDDIPEGQYEVDRVVLIKKTNEGETNYLVEWKGVNPETNLPWPQDWLPSEAMRGCHKLIGEYYARVRKEERRKRSNNRVVAPRSSAHAGLQQVTVIKVPAGRALEIKRITQLLLDEGKSYYEAYELAQASVDKPEVGVSRREALARKTQEELALTLQLQPYKQRGSRRKRKKREGILPGAAPRPVNPDSESVTFLQDVALQGEIEQYSLVQQLQFLRELLKSNLPLSGPNRGRKFIRTLYPFDNKILIAYCKLFPRLVEVKETKAGFHLKLRDKLAARSFLQDLAPKLDPRDSCLQTWFSTGKLKTPQLDKLLREVDFGITYHYNVFAILKYDTTRIGHREPWNLHALPNKKRYILLLPPDQLNAIVI